MSVNIEQIIKTPQSTGSQIEIKLKSTVHTGDNSTTEISTSTNICKEEPKEVRETSNPSSNDSLSIGIDDVDELQEILDALEKEPDLIKELDPDLKTDDSDILNDSKKQTSDDQTFTKNKSFCQTEGNMFGDNSNHLKSTGDQTPGGSAGYTRTGAAIPGNQTQMSSFGDAGPAAKTLQQMAAQHQSHQDYIEKVNIGHNYGNEGFGGERPNIASFNTQPSQSYVSQQNRNGSFNYNQHMGNMSMYRGSSSLSDSKMESLNVGPYGADTVSRPLSHYDGSVGISTPSGVQHSQHQKPMFTDSGSTSEEQFSLSNKLNTTPNTNIQFSQSQQVVLNSTDVSVSPSQSQTFGVEVSRQSIPPSHVTHESANQAESCMSEQMKIQIYQKKVMQEQHLRSQMQNNQRLFPVQANSQQFQNPNMVSTSLPSVNSQLETMQNIVTQTNPRHPTSVYRGGKPVAMSSHPHNANNSSTMLGPSGSQTVYPGTATNNTVGKMDNTGFTSTLMRGNRPPNVNIGPDGLNISQPRLNNWRQATAHRLVDPHQMPQCQVYNRHVAPNAHMYRIQMSQQQNIHMASHQRQMQYVNPVAAVPRHSFVINQQQHVHMTSGSQIMGSTHQQTSHSQSMPPNGNPHFPDFMDNAQHSTDLFEGVHSGNSSDYNLIDDILSGK